MKPGASLVFTVLILSPVFLTGDHATAAGGRGRRESSVPRRGAESVRASPVPRPATARFFSPAPPLGRQYLAPVNASDAIEALIVDGDFARAGAWLDAMGNDAVRARLAPRLVDAWARVLPEPAARWAAGEPDAPRRASMLVNVGAIWAATNATEAASFATELPDGSARDQMLATVFLQWCSRDLVGAGEWLARSDAGDIDAPLAVVATHPRAVLTMVPAALAWAELIAAPEVRGATVSAIVQEWSQRDPRAARDYVRHAAALTAPQRHALDEWLRRFARSGD